MIPEKIQIGSFYIRRLKSADAAEITNHINDMAIAKWTANIPHPYSIKDGEEFVAKSIDKWNKGTAYQFGIIVNEECVGICSLEKVDNVHKNAELGYWLGKAFWNKGIMSKVAHAVVNFAFQNLKLHRLSVVHFKDNIPSQKIIKKLGFMYEGKERESIYRFGKWHDDYWYGLLRKEWNET
jgi:[ribosomal protein S5]-alanine N-acetyltransferase